MVLCSAEVSCHYHAHVRITLGRASVLWWMVVGFLLHPLVFEKLPNVFIVFIKYGYSVYSLLLILLQLALLHCNLLWGELCLAMWNQCLSCYFFAFCSHVLLSPQEAKERRRKTSNSCPASGFVWGWFSWEWNRRRRRCTPEEEATIVFQWKEKKEKEPKGVYFVFIFRKWVFWFQLCQFWQWRKENVGSEARKEPRKAIQQAKVYLARDQDDAQQG